MNPGDLHILGETPAASPTDDAVELRASDVPVEVVPVQLVKEAPDEHGQGRCRMLMRVRNTATATTASTATMPMSTIPWS